MVLELPGEQLKYIMGWSPYTASSITSSISRSPTNSPTGSVRSIGAPVMDTANVMLVCPALAGAHDVDSAVIWDRTLALSRIQDQSQPYIGNGLRLKLSLKMISTCQLIETNVYKGSEKSNNLGKPNFEQQMQLLGLFLLSVVLHYQEPIVNKFDSPCYCALRKEVFALFLCLLCLHYATFCSLQRNSERSTPKMK